MDVRNEAYVITSLSDHIVELALNLTRRYPLRGYDAVHLATAIALNNALIGAGQSQLVFVAADTRLCDAAQGEGACHREPQRSLTVKRRRLSAKRPVRGKR